MILHSRSIFQSFSSHVWPYTKTYSTCRYSWPIEAMVLIGDGFHGFQQVSQRPRGNGTRHVLEAHNAEDTQAQARVSKGVPWCSTSRSSNKTSAEKSRWCAEMIIMIIDYNIDTIYIYIYANYMIIWCRNLFAGAVWPLCNYQCSCFNMFHGWSTYLLRETNG